MRVEFWTHIEKKNDDIVGEVARGLKDGGGKKHSEIPSEELQFIGAAAVEALIEYWRWKREEKLGRFVERLCGLRVPQGFSPADLLQTFFRLRDAIRPYLFDFCKGEASVLTAAYEELDQVIEHTVGITMDAMQERLDHLRGNIVASMIHDLRSPLTAVKTNIDLVYVQPEAALGEEDQQSLMAARAGCLRVEAMVSSIIDSVRLEEGHFPIRREVFRLMDCVHELPKLYGAWARANGITLAVEVPKGLRVDADRGLLSRILENLVSNAIKHTPSRGRVTLKARAAKGARIEVCVEDTGEGIHSGAAELLFKRFQKVSGQRYGLPADTGLGLMFCKMAVEAMGGDIWFDSAPEKGSRFYFTLRCEEPVKEPRPGAKKTPEAQEPKPGESAIPYATD